MKEISTPVHRLDRGPRADGSGQHPPRPGGAEGAAPHPSLPPCLSGGVRRRASAPSGVVDARWGPGRAPWWSRWSAPTARTPAHGMRPCPAPGAFPGPSGAGHRAHPPDPGPHGLSGLPLDRRFPLRVRGPFPDLPPCPPLRPAVPPAARHWAGAVLYPPLPEDMARLLTHQKGEKEP